MVSITDHTTNISKWGHQINSIFPSSTTSNSKVVDECETISSIMSVLNTTVPLIWLCVGTCTNILSLIIFSRKELRANSTFFYLTLMTLSDLIVIWLSSFRDFMVYKFGVYVRGSLACKLHVFSFFLFAQFSSWMLAAASFDRLVLVVSYNAFSKVWCTKAMARRFSCVLFVVFFALNLHFLINVEAVDEISAGSTIDDNLNQKLAITTTTTTTKNPSTTNQSAPTTVPPPTLIHHIVYRECQAKPGFYSLFYTEYYSWIDAFMYSFLPFLIMLVCNYTLIKKVFNSKRNLYKNIRSIDKNSSINTNPPSQSQCNEQELSLLISTASTQAKRSVRISSNGGGGGGDASLRLNGSIGEQFSSSREARLSTISLEPPSQTFTTTALDVSQNNTTANNNLNNPSTVNLNSSQHSSASTPPSSTANNNNHNSHSGKNHHHHHHHHTHSFTSCQQIPAPSMEKMRNMAITIIGVTILFIVFTVPINIYIPLMHQAEKDSATTGVKKKCEDLIFCVLNNMVNANHSTSFFIYLITNSKFKNEIKNIWKQLKIYFGFEKPPKPEERIRNLSFSRITTAQDK